MRVSIRVNKDGEFVAEGPDGERVRIAAMGEVVDGALTVDVLPRQKETEELGISITSAVSVFNGRPFCDIEWHGPPRAQLSPEDLRNHALACLEIAEAAEQDAMLMAFLTSATDVDINQAAYMIGQLRDFRADRMGNINDVPPPTDIVDQ